MFLVICFLCKLFLLASAQTTHNVTVGVVGSFFDPRTVSAAEGDTVNFIFGGDFHDITQSNFSDPCSPLPGGFSSGFLGRGSNFDGPIVTFQLTITNASEPIWYFCAATEPTSHCNSGMVGSINPSSQDMFNSFVQGAQQATTTTHFSPSLVLNGIGASATSLITLSDTNITFTPTSSAPETTPSSTSSTGSGLTSTPTSTSHSSNHGAVIGGAVAAGVGALLLFCLSVFLYRRHKRQRNFFAYDHGPNVAQSQFSANTSPPSTAKMTTNFSSPTQSPGMVNAFEVDHGGNNMMQRLPLLRPYNSSAMMSEYSGLTNIPIQPVRAHPHATSVGHLAGQNINTQGIEPIYNDQSFTNREGSYAVSNTAPAAQSRNQRRPATSSDETGSDKTMDIQALAREVAAVLQENRSKGPKVVRQADPSGGTGPSTVSDTDPAPPRYHTANNTAES